MMERSLKLLSAIATTLISAIALTVADQAPSTESLLAMMRTFSEKRRCSPAAGTWSCNVQRVVYAMPRFGTLDSIAQNL
ncbi:MAG: hypothetical protein V3V05_05590 [Pontiella sp.]